jgi:DivIVA domain-containing protein
VSAQPNTDQQPAFAMVLRGYDRDQVDEYVHRLDAWLRDWRQRAAAAEAAASQASQHAAGLRQEAADLRRQVVLLEEKGLAATPESMDGFGARVGGILRAALEAAEATRSEAEAEAERLRAEATQLAEEARRQSEDLRTMAAARVEEESVAVLERVRAEADRMLDQAQRRSQELVAAAEQRRQAVEEETDELLQRRDRALAELDTLQQSLLGVLTPRLAAPAAVAPDEEADATETPTMVVDLREMDDRVPAE